jgi:uncharacterized protein YccT (UPF0319 family)
MKETLEEVAERLYPVNNTGSMFMANRDELNNSLKQEGFIEGAKRQQEQDKNKYSDQDILDINNWYLETFLDDALGLNGNDAEQKVKHLSGKGLTKEVLDYWFEQIKKK